MPPAFTSFSALGSTAVIAVTDPALLARVRAGVQAVVSAFDLACSRFRDDSELSALCRTPGRPVPVSELLLDAVAAALRAARLTDGDVDPTLGAALRSLGYDRDYEELAARGPACVRVVEVPGWAAVRLDRAAGTVEVPRGVELDLGATAKALCADRAAAAAHAATGAGVLVSLGGDIALAGAPPQEGWKVRVTDDHRAPLTAPGQWITVHSGGLATSSTQVRRWETRDGEAHHLLDPATGRPAAGGWRTVSVCAASCLDANIASTASIVRGDAAVPWLKSLRLPARLVTNEGTALHVGGWPADGDDLPSAGPSVSVTMGHRRLQL
jgi:thiamine biosynthesis lipoprotein